MLSRALGATSMVVYLAQRPAEPAGPTLIPVVAHPDLPAVWGAAGRPGGAIAGLLPGSLELGLERPNDLAGLPLAVSERPAAPATRALAPVADGRPAQPAPQPALAPEHQMVLPMAHEGIVLGVLVSTREGQPWQNEERQQVEQVAKTLTLARVMDQRSQWLEQQLQRKQLTQSYQSETFHDLLHQFRNPLTAMRTFGKLLLKRMQSGDANQPIAEGIVRESERLEDLIEHFDQAVAVGDADLQSGDLLALPAANPLPVDRPEPAAGSGGQLQGSHLAAVLQPELLHWADILRPLLISAEAVAQDRQIQVLATLPADLPPIWADAGALREIVSNLLDNALKYSPVGAVVWVQAGLFRQEGSSTFQGVAIGDTGPGIPAADQAHIFERHYRGIQAQGQIPGTGLGLAIAHDLIADLGGQINLLSPASDSGLVPDLAAAAPNAGPGTVFIVWLPLSPA